MRLSDIFIKDLNVVSRQIAGEVILVPVSQKAGEIRGSIFTLNETAARAWELLDGSRTLGDIRTTIASEFDVDEADAGHDLLELFTQLLEIGVVQAAHSTIEAG